MLNTVNDFASFDLPPYALYGGPEVDLLFRPDGSESFSLELAFELGEHQLNWVEIRAVGRGEYMLKAQLLNTAHHYLAPMDGEVIHDEADVVEKPFGP